MHEKLDFLTATRFWAMIFGALAVWLASPDIFSPEALSQLVATVAAGFIAVKTWDRSVDKIASKDL